MTTPSNVPDDHFELGYAPAEYGVLDPESDGRWFMLSVDGAPVGTIWTDDRDGIGLVRNSGGAASAETYSRLEQKFDRYKKLGVMPTILFESLKRMPGHSIADEADGMLALIPEVPITAAVQPPVQDLGVDVEGLEPVEMEEYNFVSVDENDDVVGIGRSTEAALLLRDNGNWVPLPEDDLRFDGTEWIEIDDDVLAQYDRRIAEGLAFTREDVEDPIA